MAILALVLFVHTSEMFQMISLGDLNTCLSAVDRYLDPDRYRNILAHVYVVAHVEATPIPHKHTIQYMPTSTPKNKRNSYCECLDS